MSEQSPHSTPELTTPKLLDVPEGLQADVLDDLVGYQSEIRAKFDQQSDESDYHTFESSFIDALLDENGIRLDDDNEKSAENYNFAKGVYKQIIPMDKKLNREWLGTPEGGVSSRRTLVMDAVATWYQNQPEVAGSGPDSDKGGDKNDTEHSSVDNWDNSALSEEQLKQRDKLREKPDHNKPGESMSTEIEKVDSYFNDVREQYAKLLADRSKKTGLFERGSSVEEINKTKEDYAELVRACATELMLNMEQDGKSKDEMVETIDAFITEEVDYFIADLEAKRAEDFTKRNKLVKAGLEKWASWGPRDGANLRERFFTKGNTKKGAVYLGLGTGIGVAAMPLVGIVGGGLAITGGAVYVTKKIARNLVGARIDAAANSETIAKSQADDIRDAVSNNDERLRSGDITKDILDFANERSNEYRKRNRRRMIGGVGISLVVGGSVAGLVTAASDAGLFGKVGDWTSDKLGGLKDKYFPGDSKPEVGSPVIDVPDSVAGTEFNPADGANDAPELSTRDSLFNGQFGSRELTDAGHESLEKQLDGYKVKPGDTIWDLSEKFLQDQGVKNPTVYEIDATKDALLSELRATNSVDSRGWLSVGDKIRIK